MLKKPLCILTTMMTLGLFAFPITRNGKPAAEIVVPDSCGKNCRYAAEELQYHIARVSGAKLPIVAESAAKGEYRLCVGPTAAGVKACPEYASLPNSGWILRSAGNSLYLLGRDRGENIHRNTTETGTLYAVYEFLEKQLKIRWLWPDRETGTLCPPKRDIDSGNFNVRGEPALESAIIRRMPIDFQRKAGRFRWIMKRFPDGIRGHAFGKYHVWYGKEHPDWFAHREGEALEPVTRLTSMCVSNPEFHKEIVRRWQAERAKHPGEKIDINVCENDTPGACACARCLSWDDPDFNFKWMLRRGKNVGSRYARFALEVWKLASKIDPEVRVFGYVYSNYVFAPEDLKLNRSIMLSNVPPVEAMFPRIPEMVRDIKENLRKWQKTGASINYRPNIYGGYAMPENYVAQFYDEFQDHLKAGMHRMDIDGPNCSFATQGPVLYVMSRLPAEPKAKLEDLLDEYYSAFGPAKQEVKAYWEFWEKYMMDNVRLFYETPIKKNKLRHAPHFGWHYSFYAHVLFPPEVLKQGNALLAKAMKAAASDPVALKRVRFLKSGLDHAALCAEVCALFDDPKASNKARLDAMAKLEAFRKSMPPWAADIKYFTRNGFLEKETWVFPDFDPKSMLRLPIEWKFRADPENKGEAQGFASEKFDDSAWQTVRTDRHLENQGIRDYHHGWFRLTTEIPAKFRGKRTVLHLGAVDESCVLWINGKAAGSFTYNQAEDPGSWKKPQEFDITKFVPADGKIVISLKVTNEIGGGGLWKESEIRFFDTENQVYRWDENFLRKNLTKARGYKQYLFPVELPEGGFAYRVNGPKLGKLHPFFQFKAPFKFVAGKAYEISAEVFQHCRSGETSLLVKENGFGNSVLKHHSLPTGGIQDRWMTLTRRFIASPDTQSLTVTFMAWNVGEGDYGMIRKMELREIDKKIVEDEMRTFRWDETFLRANITRARGYKQYLFPVELPEGGFAYRVNGPTINKLHPFFRFDAPFKDPAGKSFEFSAEVFQHCDTGEASAFAAELDAKGKILKHHSLRTEKVKDRWITPALKFTAGPETKKLAVTFMAWNVNEGGYGMIKGMTLKEVPKESAGK